MKNLRLVAIAFGAVLGAWAGNAAYEAFESRTHGEESGRLAAAPRSTESAPSSDVEQTETEAQKTQALEQRRLGLLALQAGEFEEAAVQFALALDSPHAPADVPELLDLAKSLHLQAEAQKKGEASSSRARQAPARSRPSEQITSGPRPAPRPAARRETGASPTSASSTGPTAKPIEARTGPLAQMRADAGQTLDEENPGRSSITEPPPPSPAPVTAPPTAASTPSADPPPTPKSANPFEVRSKAPPSGTRKSLTNVSASSREEIRAGLRRVMPQVRQCYERELASNPRLSGRVRVQMSVEADGRVKAVTIKSTTLDSEVTIACIVRLLRRAEFPRSDLPLRRYSVPLAFAPGRR